MREFTEKKLYNQSKKSLNHLLPTPYYQVKRILLTGKTGQVGWELQRSLAPLGRVIALDRTQMDLTNPDSIRQAIRETAPNIIVNAAGYTAVDKSEAEPELAIQVNAVAPGVMAEEARRLGALIIHYSTDYVFDGFKDGSYSEEDPTNPLSAYGRSKLMGEQAIQSAGAPHLIFRTSWVYSARGNNFVRTILRLARERGELKIVNDQVGAPTSASTIAEITAQVLAQAITAQGFSMGPLLEKSGLYHLTAAGAVSWFGFAEAILTEAETVLGIKVPSLIPISTSDYPLPAQRPANSRLNTARLTRIFGLMPPNWDSALKSCIRELATQ